MKKLFMVLPLVFLLCFTFGCQQAEEVAEEPVVDVEAEVDAIKIIEAEFDKTSMIGDIEGNMANVADDAVFMIPNSPSIVGKDACRAWMKAFMDGFNTESEHSPDKIDIVGKWAIVPGICTGFITLKSGGEPIPFNNKYLHIYRKQPDGTWKLSRSIFNSNDPLPTSEKNQ